MIRVGDRFTTCDGRGNTLTISVVSLDRHELATVDILTEGRFVLARARRSLLASLPKK